MWKGLSMHVLARDLMICNLIVWSTEATLKYNNLCDLTRCFIILWTIWRNMVLNVPCIQNLILTCEGKQEH